MEYEISSTCMLINIGLTRSECASWVQAWGSILAIFFSIGGVLLSFHLSTKKEIERQNVVAFVEASLTSSFLIGYNNKLHQVLDQIADLAKTPASDRDLSSVRDQLKNNEFLNGGQMLALHPVGISFAQYSRSAILLQRVSSRIADRGVSEGASNVLLNELHGCLKQLHEYAFQANAQLIHYINSQDK